MRNPLFGALSWLLTLVCHGQPNCLIHPEGSGERRACEFSHKAVEYDQGSRVSQLYFDSAIAIGPRFAWAYYEKSVPYIKRGLPHIGIHILNHAVELEPLNYLCYRAYWYFQYRNYERCITDLETYYSMPGHYVQFDPGGDFNMMTLLGLAYSKLGEHGKAVRTIERCMERSDVPTGPYDHHALGVVHYVSGDLQRAEVAFMAQIAHDDRFADSHYYLGLVYERQGDLMRARPCFDKALQRFKGVGNGYSIRGFCHPVSSSDVMEAVTRVGKGKG